MFNQYKYFATVDKYLCLKTQLEVQREAYERTVSALEKMFAVNPVLDNRRQGAEWLAKVVLDNMFGADLVLMRRADLEALCANQSRPPRRNLFGTLIRLLLPQRHV